MRREYWLALVLGGILAMLPLQYLSLALLLFLPGLAIFLMLKEKSKLVELVAFSFTVSMLIFPLAVLIFSFLPLHVTGIVLGLIPVAVGLYKFWKNAPFKLEKTGWVAVAIAGLIFLGMLYIMSLTFAATDSGFLCASTHASDLNFHLSIAQRYVESPQIPPQDPYLPGYDITYNWFMHVLFGELGVLNGLDAIMVFKIAVPLACALIFLDTYLLACLIFKDDTKAALSAAAVYVFTGGMSWIYIAYQYLQGIDPDLFHLLVYDWGADFLGMNMTLKFDPVTLYFFMPQTQTFGLVAMIFGFYLFIQATRKKSIWYALLAGAILASLVLFHMITAFPTLAALGLYMLYLLWKDRDLQKTAIMLVPLVIGGIAVLYQLSLLAGNAGSQIRFSTHPGVIPALVMSLGPLIPFAIWGMFQKRKDDAAMLLIIFAILNVIFIGIMELPLTYNTYRFLVYLALPVCMFAGYVIYKWLTKGDMLKKAAAVLVLLLVIPSAILMVVYYQGSLVQPYVYAHASVPEMKGLDWIKENTPANAVIYEMPGMFPRVSVYTGRQVAYSGQLYTIQYHDIDRQYEMESLLDIQNAEELHQKLSSDGVNYVFVGHREGVQKFMVALADSPLFRKVYDEDGIQIYEVTGVPIR